MLTSSDPTLTTDVAVLDVRGLRYARSATRQDPKPFALCVDQLRLRAGQLLALTGESGCGKSTVLDLVAMMRRPDDCESFKLAGVDVRALWSDGGAARCTQLRARSVGVVLQTGGLIASLSVIDNISLGQRLLGIADDPWISELFHRLGLVGLRHRLPAQLSIGQRQRVAIARALAHRPELVLADEPTASLGTEHAEQVMGLLVELVASSGCALLLASHDLQLLSAHGVATVAARAGPDCVHFAAPERLQ